MDCFTKLLGWSTLNLSVVDSSVLVSLAVLFWFRVFVFLFCLFAYISHFVDDGTDSAIDAASWFKFITHWNSVNMCVYFGLAAWFTLRAAKDPSRSLQPLSHHKVGCFLHFMSELTYLTGWFVSILYWAAIYRGPAESPKGYFAFLDVCMHGLPALFTGVDLFLGNTVLVQFHLWMMYLYFFVYLAVNAAVTVLTEPIYTIMTYETASTVIWIVVSCVLVLVIWLGLYLGIRLRTRCCSRRRARSIVVFSKDGKLGVDPVV